MKKSELVKLNLPQLRAFAVNNAIKVDNNLTKPKTLNEILNSDFKFVPEEPKSGKFFKIGTRQIEALGNYTSIARIKSFIAWELAKLKKANPDYKSSDLTVTLPNGTVIKATQLNYAAKFVQKEFFGPLFASDDLTKEQKAIKSKVQEIIKHASKMRLDWNKLGTENDVEIANLFDYTIKDMTAQGLIQSNEVPQIAMY